MKRLVRADTAAWRPLQVPWPASGSGNESPPQLRWAPEQPHARVVSSDHVASVLVAGRRRPSRPAAAGRRRARCGSSPSTAARRRQQPGRWPPPRRRARLRPRSARARRRRSSGQGSGSQGSGGVVERRGPTTRCHAGEMVQALDHVCLAALSVGFFLRRGFFVDACTACPRSYRHLRDLIAATCRAWSRPVKRPHLPDPDVLVVSSGSAGAAVTQSARATSNLALTTQRRAAAA